jgi:hypothetical protein
MAEDLTYTEFRDTASHLHVDEEIWEELYPMVRDLLAIAQRLEELAPELHGEIELPAPVEETGDP